jgi:peroxiredoxin (alkyl hydroperoxide reductase subunit C)
VHRSHIRILCVDRPTTTYIPTNKNTAHHFHCSGTFKELSLADYKGQWLVLFFYPLDFTFVCPTEICGFSDKMDAFKALNTAVVGASLDSVFTHTAWRDTARAKGGIGAIDYPLLADIHRQVSADYGCLMYVARQCSCHVILQSCSLARNTILTLSITLQLHVYSPGDDPLSRGLFIIDPAGQLRYASRQHPPVGRNVDEVLRLVEAYQVCSITLALAFFLSFLLFFLLFCLLVGCNVDEVLRLVEAYQVRSITCSRLCPSFLPLLFHRFDCARFC